jgi:hypothetical protein
MHNIIPGRALIHPYQENAKQAEWLFKNESNGGDQKIAGRAKEKWY